MTVVCVMTKTLLHYKNNVIGYPNNNSNYFSISTGSPGRKFPLTELYLVFLSLSLSFPLRPSVALSLEAKLQMLHSYMTVAWLPLPCEVRIFNPALLVKWLTS